MFQAILELVIFIGGPLFLWWRETRDRKARIAYHTEKLRECNMKGDKELAEAHMKALTSAQRGM